MIVLGVKWRGGGWIRGRRAVITRLSGKEPEYRDKDGT